MERTILHSDLNNFYASVECLYRPEIRNKPVAVCGDPAVRHGIVLAKNYLAKATGIQTGEAIWQAKQKCPQLVVIHPNYPLYLKFSRLAQSIYASYSDQVEAFGLDEAWLDVTHSSHIFGNGIQIANAIRERIKLELGVTVSVGVSYNKIFAKLGSDLKKPDATTVISKDNFKQIVWPLPAGDLLYVGRATYRKLVRWGIDTIGDIAGSDPLYLKSKLGKWGEVLWSFANGYDQSAVIQMGEDSMIKSVGNSITTPRDLENNEDVLIIIYALSESVAARLREHGLKCRTVHIHIRDKELFAFGVQGKLSRPGNLSSDIAEKAMALFQSHYSWANPIRSIGVRGCDLIAANSHEQLFLFADEKKRIKQEKIAAALDTLRQRFGYFSVQRAVLLKDPELGSINPKDEHIIHPVAFAPPSLKLNSAPKDEHIIHPVALFKEGKYHNPNKLYVSVKAVFDPDGGCKPTSLIWEDGREFVISKVTDIRRAASLKAGGLGIRYTCKVGNRDIYLFLEDDRWFMVRNEPG